MTYPPDLDAVGGRSYKQSSQTAGALSGRRDVVQWYKDGAVSTHNMIVKVAGAAWRLIGVTANVRVAPTGGAVKVDILAKMPGESSYATVFNLLPSIAVGQLESSGGVFNPSRSMLPIGTLVSMTVGASIERLIALGKDASPREQSRLIGGVWDTPIAITGINSNAPSILPITASLWFAINSDITSDAWGWGVGARTEDGGNTWSATPDPGVGGGGIKHIAADAGGRLWCIVHDTGSTWVRTAIYSSDTDGDSWTLSTTHGSGGSPQASKGWKVVPHPTDPNTIAIIGFSANVWGLGNVDGYILITKNRGASWTVEHNSDIRNGQAAMWPYDSIMLSDGRIIAHGPFVIISPTNWYTLYSDTDGATWNQGILQTGSLLRANGLYVSEDENVIAYMWTDLEPTLNEHRLYISTNQGESFSLVTLAVELEDFVGEFDSFEITRLTTSTVHDAIYIATDRDPIDIVKLSPVGASGVWTDLTDAYPHNSQGQDNLGVVPGSAPSGAEDITVELHHRTRAVSQ